MSLLEAQQRLLAAILQGGSAPAGLFDAGTGLAAYRGNLRALSARALGSVFASVQAELGEDDFALMAWRFWREHAPEHGDLGEWGGELAGFLACHAGEESGLPHLARRDWAVHRAERAADVALDANSLGLLALLAPEHCTLKLRPGVALVDGRTLVWRDGWQGRWQDLAPAEAGFVAALLRGTSLASALEHALDQALDGAAVKGIGAEPDFDFGAWLQAALQQAWLQAAVPLASP